MIYVILGTTASGKTDLAIRLAKEFSMPLISCDAYQVYKEFELGTACPRDEELEGIDHHFFKYYSIDDPIDVKKYQKEVRKLLDEYLEKGQDVILSGGTFLYVRAALFSYEFPDEEENNTYDSYSDEELYEMLKNKDPELAATLHPNNSRRVKRALINLDNNKKANKDDLKLLYPARFFAIDKSIEEVNQNIVLRCDKMFEQGLIEEVKKIVVTHKDLTTAFMAIGYKEVLNGLQENKTLEEIKQDVIVHTRQYAKRQRTFLRHQFKNLIQLKSEEIYKLISLDQKKKTRTIASLGKANYSKIENKKVLVCGLGGVGAIVVSSLARIGVKNIAILDKDVVEESNLNRQMLYDIEDISKSKVDVAEQKLKEIDPLIQIKKYHLLLNEDNVKNLGHFDFIFDCIDDVKAKVALVKYALENNIDIIMCTGTARKKDSTMIKMGYLKDTGEPLARACKRKLVEQGIDIDKIKVIYSNEPALKKTKEILPSLPTVPNAAGLSMVTYFIKTIIS